MRRFFQWVFGLRPTRLQSVMNGDHILWRGRIYKVVDPDEYGMCVLDRKQAKEYIKVPYRWLHDAQLADSAMVAAHDEQEPTS